MLAVTLLHKDCLHNFGSCPCSLWLLRTKIAEHGSCAHNVTAVCTVWNCTVWHMSAQCDSCLHSMATALCGNCLHSMASLPWVTLSPFHGPGSSFENVAVVKSVMDIIYKDMAVSICRSRTVYKVVYIIMFVNGQTWFFSLPRIFQSTKLPQPRAACSLSNVKQMVQSLLFWMESKFDR